MTDAHTVQTVLGRKKPAGGVAARDFQQPRRLSAKRLAAFHSTLKNLLPALEKKLAETTGLRFALALEALAEADAETLLARAADAPCALRFRCQKAPAWCFWEPAAAAGAVEAILGAKTAASPARRLSPTESRIAAQLLSEVVRAVAGGLGLAVTDFALVQAKTELGSWRDAGAEAESYRLEVPLVIRLGEQASTLRLYLCGIASEEEEGGTSLPADLPAHLELVEVELSACLTGCEISLDQLLALEAGDVIPLEARLGDPAVLSIEGRMLAQARLGRHRGRLAVRIERLDVQQGVLA